MFKFSQLFSEWKRKKESNQASFFGKILETLLTNKEQRLEAITALQSMSPEVAVPQLFKRFKISVDHAIQDKKEKEMVLEILIQHPDISRQYLETSMQSYPKISWLLLLAQKILQPDEWVDLLLRQINPDFVSFDESVQEKNAEILLALKEYPHPRALEAVSLFLHSRDENLRAANLELLEVFCAQKNEKALEILSNIYQYFHNNEYEKEENPRIFHLVQTIYQRYLES